MSASFRKTQKAYHTRERIERKGNNISFICLKQTQTYYMNDFCYSNLLHCLLTRDIRRTEVQEDKKRQGPRRDQCWPILGQHCAAENGA